MPYGLKLLIKLSGKEGFPLFRLGSLQSISPNIIAESSRWLTLWLNDRIPPSPPKSCLSGHDAIAVAQEVCIDPLVMSSYHKWAVGRAEAAAATGSLFTVMIEVQLQAALWAIPAAIALLVCWFAGLSGTAALLVSTPLVVVSVGGSCVYTGWIFARAVKQARVR